MADLENGSTVSGFPIIHEGNVGDLINFYDNIDDVVLKPYLKDNYAQVFYDRVGTHPKNGDILVEEGPIISMFSDSWKEVYPGSLADLISDIKDLIPTVINSVTSTSTTEAGSADAVRRAYEKGKEALDYAKNIDIPTIPFIPTVINSVGSSDSKNAGSANAVKRAYEKGQEALDFAKGIKMPTIPSIPDEVTVLDSISSSNQTAAGSANAVRIAYEKAKQALDAVNGAKFSSNSSKAYPAGADDGYVKYPGGVMMQWMSVQFGSSSTKVVNFPTPFKERVYTVQISHKTINYGVIETDVLVDRDWDITNNLSSVKLFYGLTGDSGGNTKPLHTMILVIGKQSQLKILTAYLNTSEYFYIYYKYMYNFIIMNKE